MTQFTDPVRWTASPGDAPDVLRDVFQAGGREAPDPGQMRTLSLKLAAAVAAGAGAAAAGGAMAKPLAATLGGGSVKTVFAGAKLLAAMTVAGAVTIGSAVVYRSVNNEPTFQSGAAVSGQAVNDQAVDDQAGGEQQAQPAQATAPAVVARTNEHPSIAPVISKPAPVLAPIELSAPATASTGEQRSVLEDQPVARPSTAGTRSSKATPARAADRVAASQPTSAKADAARSPTSTSVDAPLSELGLLRQAQQALEVRPREAFALTQKHRASFPRGQFAEERDALAIQALLRAGERDEALDLAERFVAAHPNSAHAHQVRELLNSR